MLVGMHLRIQSSDGNCVPVLEAGQVEVDDMVGPMAVIVRDAHQPVVRHSLIRNFTTSRVAASFEQCASA